MSKEDVDTIRTGLDALNRRDLDAMLANLQPDAEMVPLRAVLDGTVYRGHDGLRQWLADMAEDWDDLRIETEELRDLQGGRVLVLGRFHARGKSSGVNLDHRAAWICEVAGGRMARIRFFEDAAAALRAAASPAPPD
jgi:ketosteroid isomerase-like protein